MANKRGSIDYSVYNYCSVCDQKYLKPINRCLNRWCNQKLRSIPHYTRKGVIREHKRID